VETLDELDLVRHLGCSHVQGFIYDMPLSFDQATTRLATGLNAIAKGPRSARAARHTMLRKVIMEHGGNQYKATVRNVSHTGALVEGLWNVPPGTVFRLHWAEGVAVMVTSRWSKNERMGVEFEQPGAVRNLPGVAPPETGPIAAPRLRRVVGK
jgi:hypothetical protein